MSNPEPHKTVATHGTSPNTRVLFIPGHRTRNLETYQAKNAIVAACANTPGLICDTITFPITSIGRHDALPSFAEMVQTAKSSFSGDVPTIVVGHCTGAAVAVELAKSMPSRYAASFVFLCPPVSLHEEALQRAKAFRIFGYSTHIPKAAFVSKSYKNAMTIKTATISTASRVFQPLLPENLAHIPSQNLVFVGATRDNLCDPRATARLAEILGYPYLEMTDKHSLKTEETARKLQALIQKIKYDLTESAAIPNGRTTFDGTQIAYTSPSTYNAG